jgi:hypothetical protein
MSLQPVARAADDKCVDGSLQAFDTWMNGGGPLYISAAAIVYVALAPVFVLVHELGHAAVALLRTDGRVHVQVGKTPATWRLRLGRLDLALNPYIPRKGGAAGFAKPYGRFDPYSRIAFAVAGSTASGVFSALVVFLALRAHVMLLVWVGAIGVYHSVYSLVPRKSAGPRGDGNALLEAVRRLRHGPTPEDMKVRWLALVKDIDGTLGRNRGQVLNAVPHLVEHPGTGPDSTAVWRIAFEGWCWRAVEGDASEELREAALDAIREATSSGAVEPNLTIIAARSLAGREPSVGFDHVIDVRSTDVDEAKQRWAFQFGAAFYDIERVRGSVG